MPTKDKFPGHFNLGLAVSVITVLVGLQGDASFLTASVFGLINALIVGLLKEWLDHRDNCKRAKQNLTPRHTVELDDIVYTTIGGAPLLVVAGITIIIERFPYG